MNAVQCAIKIQTTLKSENANLPPDRRLEFRIGVNLGDVMVDGEQIYGDGVNVAARLESLAEPGGICVSGTVCEHLSRTSVSLSKSLLRSSAPESRICPISSAGASATTNAKLALRP